MPKSIENTTKKTNIVKNTKGICQKNRAVFKNASKPEKSKKFSKSIDKTEK